MLQLNEYFIKSVKTKKSILHYFIKLRGKNMQDYTINSYVYIIIGLLLLHAFLVDLNLNFINK